MKSLRMTAILVSALVVSLTGSLSASAADGTRGGGEVVIVNGTERLRDLVDPTVCEYKTGEELRKEDPEIDRVLAKLAELDWYFAAGLRWEIDHLQFCLTTQLIRLRSLDPDSVILHEPVRTEQAAIRFLGSWDVYVNRGLLARLPVTDRPYLPIHEAMHSFIPPHAPHRNESVRAAVRAIADVASGKIKSARKLHQIFDNNSVIYPWTAPKLAPSQKAIEFALGSFDDKKAMILNATDLNALFDQELGRMRNWIYAPHEGDLQAGGAVHVAQLLEEEGRDYTVLDRFINAPPGAPRFLAFDPVLVALSVSLAQENPEYQDHILNSQAMKAGFLLYSTLKSKGFNIGNSRILGNPAFVLMGTIAQGTQNFPGETPALAVIPYVREVKSLIPAEIRGFVQFIVTQARGGDRGMKVLEAAVFGNDEFYAAFGIAELNAQLEGLTPPIAREKAHLRASLPELVRGFRRLVITSLTEGAGPEQAARLDRAINWERLGLKECK